MARQTPDAIDAPFRKPAGFHRPCQHEGCPEPADYRAPKSPHLLNQYYWFCLDHVRDYNKAWDYFVGMNETEIEAQRREDAVWQRPSWPLGSNPSLAEAEARAKLEAEFGFSSTHRTGRGNGTAAPRSEDEKALAVLDLSRPVTFPEIKARYKELVKKLHPDANGGDTQAEDRLKLVNQAYSTLKASFVQ